MKFLLIMSELSKNLQKYRSLGLHLKNSLRLSRRMLRQWRKNPNMNQINAKTRVCAVLGDPIGHSLSPVMHNAAYATLGLDCVYVACRVEAERLSEAVYGLRALEMIGVNVTIPHKKAVIPYLDEIFGDSLYSGSVNTIIHRDGKLSGTSTDGMGLVHSLQRDGNFDPAGKKVVLLGAGGSAPAVIYSLIGAGIQSLTVINRNFQKALDLQAKVERDVRFHLEVKRFEELEQLELENFDLLVNTTSVGLLEDASLIKPQQLTPALFVYDLVYKKGGTQLVNQATAAGCQVLSGLSMLLYQGAASFRLWFETEPPLEVMRKALNEACS